MVAVIQFHNLSHIFISLIGAILLLAIYSNIRQRFRQILAEDDSQKRVDSGLLYLSLAMFVWVASGTWAYFGNYMEVTENFGYSVGVNLLSIVNNGFLLLAIFYFYHAPAFIYKNERNVRIILTIIVAVTLLTLGISYLGVAAVVEGVNVLALPDLLLSGFLCYLLGTSLFKTFLHRGLRLVAYISVIVVALTFFSQLPEVFPEAVVGAFGNLLIKIVAKTSLISIFLVLATSWVIQLANTPRINEMQLKFTDWSLIQLSIPSKAINGEAIDFGSKTTQYKNLLKFAIRRKFAEGEDQAIVVSSGGEIKNQAYLSRIIDNINEIAQLAPDQKLERRDIFTFLGEGRYRLRILAERIEIDESLLQEFAKSTVNKGYAQYL